LITCQQKKLMKDAKTIPVAAYIRTGTKNTKK
jgi:hypothetical protein